MLNKSNFWPQTGSEHHIPDPVAIFRGKTKVQNHQLESLQQGAHQSRLTDILAWYEETKAFSRGCPQRYSELAMMLECIRRVWRKRHLAVDADTHEVTCADLSLNNVTDTEAFPGLIRQTHRKVRVASADGAYDTKRCHDELRRKKIRALIPPRTHAGYWKWNTAYNRRSVAETAMYRVKQLFGGNLTLRDYDAQVGEAMAMIRVLNKMTRAGMPESVRIA